MPDHAYDDDNVFAKILRGEIPCQRIHESAHALAFRDIQPLAALHALVIPKGRYVDFADFAARADDAEQAGFWRAAAETARLLGAAADGYRLLSNCGANARQEVPHFHLHIFGGEKLGAMLPPRHRRENNQ